MFRAFLFTGLLLVSCSQAPRWEPTTVSEDESHFTVRAPLLTEADGLQLIHVRDIMGDVFPFEPGIWTISDIESDTRGTIYLADSGHNHITKFSVDGQYLGKIGSRGPGPFEFQTSVGPSAISWIADSDMIVATDIYRTVLFNSDGSPYGNNRIGLTTPSLTATVSSFITCRPANKPFIEFDYNFIEIRRFGRPLLPEDTPWPEAKERLAQNDIEYKYEQVGPPPHRLFHAFEAVSDSFLVHALESRNSYRCWNRITGEFTWQLNLDVEDYEPPTFWAYSSSFETAEFSWKEGDIRTHQRTRPLNMSWCDGLLFVSVQVEEKGRRNKPDKMKVSSIVTLEEELNEGWTTRSVIVVLSMKPDLIAQIPLDIAEYAYIEVLPNHLLLVASNDPSPIVRVFEIAGLWDQVPQ